MHILSTRKWQKPQYRPSTQAYERPQFRDNPPPPPPPPPPPQCHIYALVNRVSSGSDNGFAPIRRQAIIGTNAGIWNIVNWTLRNKVQWNLNRNSCIFIQENVYENIVCEMAAILSRGRWVKHHFRRPLSLQLKLGRYCNFVRFYITISF